MARGLPSIEICPPQLAAEALALVLTEIAPSQRREIASAYLEAGEQGNTRCGPLYVAMRDEQLFGAAWGQRQVGNIAMFWPPQLMTGEGEQTAIELAKAVIGELDNLTTEMTQSLLPGRSSEGAELLGAVGFRHLADLLYMSCEGSRFPEIAPESGDLEFEPYAEEKRERLKAIVERTYEQTLDCIELNGRRTIDEVITGYQATGAYRAENWQIVRTGEQDVGILLMTEHPQAIHWELMYMGLAREARGQGRGRHIAERAKWMAKKAGMERIVLGVDATNTPALRTYGAAGFEPWDRRSVFVRFAEKKLA